jgi:hypothetical protein
MAEKRRMRVRRKASSIIPPNGDDLDKLNGMLYSIAATEEQILALQASSVQLRDDTFKEMKRLGLKEQKNGRCDATIVRPAGRSQTKIDPREYQEAVADEDAFYDSISVSVTKAKEHLSGKELANVSKVTPAVPGTPVLKVKIIPAKQEDAEAA